ncbi:PstS family phosphate ABC transporter substrate-binding protein [Deltaproteobacteria bacterium TL4]
MKRLLALVTLFGSLMILVSSVHASRKVLQNKGSDTLVNVAQAWAEAYQKVDSEVAIAVTGGGSGTGIAALINGTVDIANASRSIEDKEIRLAKKNGNDPLEFVVGYDAVSVFINLNNPLQSITLDQLADIYGEDGTLDNWGKITQNVKGCEGQKIIRVSRQNNSGTYAYFREAVLGERRDYKSGSLDMQGSKDVVDLVEKTPCAIGYSGLAYATPRVKMLCIAKKSGQNCINPSVASASDGSYPIARPLMMYTNGKPKGEVKKYMDWILSDIGQCILLKKGYAPIREVHCN